MQFSKYFKIFKLFTLQITRSIHFRIQYYQFDFLIKISSTYLIEK